ncbi:ABC transporter permease [Rothia aerolata]|uniref:Peptide ABC transporter permease n=1 Tax=Rothia aerolata TaxID=1812262 RepID=A0A917IUH0_9MICC|nr:ABC transporter permease [Rothia aerolata]GGH64827.1 peptide ABC transporter permease [Rothia aerolata]
MTVAPDAEHNAAPPRESSPETPLGLSDEQLAQPDFKIINKSAIITRRFFRNKTAVVGLVIFILMGLFGLFGGFISRWDTNTIDPLWMATGPSAEHWFGTTSAGTDLYAQAVEGVRTSMAIGLIVGGLTVLISAMYGCAMAYFGGKIDAVMLFILETMIMVPNILIVAIVINGNAGKQIREALPGWLILTIVLLIFNWMYDARVIRSMSMSLIQRDYVKAARYMGVGSMKIVWRHLIPNIGSLLVLNFTRGITAAILSEVAFTFIGIGVKYPNYSLGSLIAQASSQINTLPWMFWIPMILFFLLVAPLSMMNDGLRDAFDPTSLSVGKAKKKNKKGRAKK